MTDSATLHLRQQLVGKQLSKALSSFKSIMLDAVTAALGKNPPEGVSVGLGDDENMFKWECMIMGPQDTL